MSYEKAEAAIESVYEKNDGSPEVERFHQDHEIDSLLILTVDSYRAAYEEVKQFRDRIRGKVVVEIGAGVGMLAIEMAKWAKTVYAIEADPAWTHVFTDCLYSLKPPNLTWIFGSARQMVGIIKADVAVIYTRSGVKGMEAIARAMAPEVIRGPLLSFEERHPEAKEFMPLMERVAKHFTPDKMSRHGLPADELQAAIDAETRVGD